MHDAKEMKTPMHPTTNLGLDEESNKVDGTQYRAMIGSLLYLTTLHLISCLVFAYVKDFIPTNVKRIFRYLSGTTNLGLCFKQGKAFRLISYYDVDYAEDKVKRKSTSGSCHFIGGNLVIEICKKQGSIALSTAEVEYISVACCYTQLIWIKTQLEDYNIFETRIPIYCDNKVAISLSKNPTLHSRAKHIEIKHDFLKDHAQKGTMDLHFVPTKNQFVDIFTKPLNEDMMILLRNQLGMDFVKE